jgi:hypothetical protein
VANHKKDAPNSRTVGKQSAQGWRARFQQDHFWGPALSNRFRGDCLGDYSVPLGVKGARSAKPEFQIGNSGWRSGPTRYCLKQVKSTLLLWMEEGIGYPLVIVGVAS